MYAELSEFAEETLFGLIGRIRVEPPGALDQCHKLLCIYLGFCEKYLGNIRLLTGQALTGESLRLHQQVEQLYQRLEIQLKPYLREAETLQQLRTHLPVATAANLLISTAESRVSQS